MAKTTKKRVSHILREPATPYRRTKPSHLNIVRSNLQKVSHNAEANPQEHYVSHWLGGGEKMRSSLHSSFDIINAGAEGIAKSSIDALAAHLGISRKSMAEDILDLSVKTLERKAPSEKLDRRTSSHALEIAKVVQHAYNVFEDEEKMKRWLNSQNRALNNMKPVQLFGTLTGLSLVNDILGRIEEGIYS